MSTSQSLRRSTPAATHVLFSAVLLASVSSARAQNATYNLVDYPASQTDTVTGGADHITGQIITDATFGQISYSSNQIVSASFTLTTSSGATYPVSSAFWYGFSPYLFTASANLLTVPLGDSLFLTSQMDDSWLYTTTNLNWNRNSPFDQYVGSELPPSPADATALFAADAPFPTSPGNIGSNDPWIIATLAPEPASLTLLGSALLGLAGVVYLRRRLAKA